MTRTISALLTVALLSSVGSLTAGETAGPPKVGRTAPHFEAKTVTGETLSTKELAKKGKTVVVVLRGFPGYQCPICQRQVGEFLLKADAFKQRNTNVVMIYPGAGDDLAKRAAEFIADRTVPSHFSLVIDPDYSITNAYNLRWKAPRETAYPSTFVLNSDWKVEFAKVSKSHGGRVKAKTVLNALDD